MSEPTLFLTNRQKQINPACVTFLLLNFDFSILWFVATCFRAAAASCVTLSGLPDNFP